MAQWQRVCLMCRYCSFDPWVQKIPWRRKWQPTPVLLPGKSHGSVNICRVIKSANHSSRHHHQSLTWLNNWGHAQAYLNPSIPSIIWLLQLTDGSGLTRNLDLGDLILRHFSKSPLIGPLLNLRIECQNEEKRENIVYLMKKCFSHWLFFNRCHLKFFFH